MRLDLTNQVYGLIKCLEPSESLGRRTTWLCECTKCGARKVIRTCDIRSGRVKTCGCYCTEESTGSQRICQICGKPFATQTYGSTRKYCYECSPKGSVANRVVGYRHSTKAALVAYKGGKCERCGYDKCIDALQFHHLDPNEKDFTLSKSTRPYEELKAEVDKCILLCANCHAEVHYELNQQKE